MPAFALVYPRPGLPALVEAGDTLIARVRLPSPLTPPPGVQQPRALAGWHAALIGHALAWPAQAELEQRHSLEVTNVRPDETSSLVYRASLVVPAWVAPGTYDLELAAPGGSDRAIGQVGGDREAGGVAAGVGSGRAGPGDAGGCVAESEPESESETNQNQSPTLMLDSVVAALRIAGSGLWVLGDCDERGRFSEDVASVMAREKRSRLGVHAPQATGPGYALWDEPLAWRAWPSSDALRIKRNADNVSIARSDAGADLEIALVFASDGRGVATSAGTLRFYPAAPINRALPPPITAVLRLPAGASASITRTSATPRDFQLVAQPSAPRSGAAVQVRLVSRDAQAQVALAFDPLHGAFARSAAHAYPELGEQRIAALAIAHDGVAVPLSARVVVHADPGRRLPLRARRRRPACPAGRDVAGGAFTCRGLPCEESVRKSGALPASRNRLRCGRGLRRT